MRDLTLAEVPDELLKELGLRPNCLRAETYACSDSTAVLIPLAEISAPPNRLLNREALRTVLIRMRDDLPLDPVPVFREESWEIATLLDGMHRLRASAALGFPMMPCRLVPRADAEVIYGVQPPNN
jgi:hypothetical protein